MVSFYNPQRRSAVNIVPGLIGVILTMTMVLFTGVATSASANAAQHGAADRHPITRSELMIGKVLPYVAIGLVQVTWCCSAPGCSRCRCAAACWMPPWPPCC